MPGKKIIITAIAGLAVALTGCASMAGSSGRHMATSTSPAAPAEAAAGDAATPAPQPSPDGTYSGSCDYTLGDDPVDGTARAIGEVDLENTGNIGTIVHVKITWPQEGYAPIAAHKTVRVRSGHSKAVRFHVPLTYDELDQLQSWQEDHGFKDGCHYRSSITGTFGQAH